MFDTNNVWVDVALMTTLFAVGNIVAGHWEQHTPKWRRLLKCVIFTALAVLISATAGRIWVFGMLGALSLAVLYIHGVWLPRHGINGWTGEPKARYYALRGWRLE